MYNTCTVFHCLATEVYAHSATLTLSHPHILYTHTHTGSHLHSLKVHEFHLIKYKNEGWLLREVHEAVGGGLQENCAPIGHAKESVRHQMEGERNGAT